MLAKFKACGGMPYDVFTHLYDVMVQSVIKYGAAIWGTQSYSRIKSVQMRASRFFLGVGKYTPNAAVQGEMGWDFPQQRIGVCIARLWCREVNLDDCRLNKRVFKWAKDQPPHLCTWFKRARSIFSSIDVDFCNEVNIENVRSVISNVDAKLKTMYIEEWKNDLNKVEGINGTGRNKLRTYRLFKADYEVEKYVKQNLTRKCRSAYAKFRCGVAPLRIETGRYIGLEESQRTCYFCENVVENEVHVITQCNKYLDIRNNLYAEARNVVDGFDSLNDCDKFVVLFKNDNLCYHVAKASDMILNQRLLFLSKNM